MNGNTISTWIAGLGMWPLLVVLVPNLLFRKYGTAAGRKRMASLLQAISVFLITSAAGFVVARGLTDAWLLAAAVLVGVLLVVFRDRVFPYRLKCTGCGTSLDFKSVYFMDDNLCPKCREAAAPAAADAPDDGNESGNSADSDNEG